MPENCHTINDKIGNFLSPTKNYPNWNWDSERNKILAELVVGIDFYPESMPTPGLKFANI